MMATFFLFIIFVTIFMTILAMNLWGSTISHYKSFSEAFLSVIFISLGIISVYNVLYIALTDLE
jgi:hypothetical protein